jgi:type I restriction enzyme, S subunit
MVVKYLTIKIKNENWKIVDLPEVVFFQEGPGVRNNQYTNNGVKLLNVANLQDGQVILENTERYISEEEAYGRYKHFLADEGDLVIASSGIKVEYFDKKMGFIKKEHLPLCMNTSTIRFKSLNQSVLDIRYFMYFLKSIYFKKQLFRLITGSAQLNFGPSHLKKIKVILPDISSQIRIVELLDKAQLLIDNRKAQIEALDQLTQSVFLEMFGDLKNNKFKWKIAKLGEVCPFIKDGPHVSPNYTDKGVPFISVNNIIKDKWDFTNVKYISESDYETFAKRCKPEKGDILYTKGGTTGFAKYIDIDTKFINWVHLAVLKYDKKILNGIFLTHMLNSHSCYVQSQKYTRGIANRDLVLGQMKKIKVMVPPLEEQEKFEKIIMKINEQKENFESNLFNIENNYNSIMQLAFKRKLFTQEKLPNV